MKIYRIWGSGPDGHYLRWASTRAEVPAMRRELKEADCGLIKVTRIDFPTEQPAIVNWLNAYFNMDNG